MDRKDKFRRKKAIDNKKELRYWRKRAQEIIDGVDSSELAYNNMNTPYPPDDPRREGLKHSQVMYRRFFNRLNDRYINRYIFLEDKLGIGIILQFEYLNHVETQAVLDLSNFDSWMGRRSGCWMAGFGEYDINKNLQFGVFDIFDPSIKYSSIDYQDRDNYLLSTAQTKQVDQCISEYYQNYNTQLKRQGIQPSTYDTETCYICLENYDETTSLKTKTTRCGHKFHYDCLKKWEEQSDSYFCPCCKQLTKNNFNEIHKDMIKHLK